MVDRSRAGRLLGLAVLLEVVVGIGGRPFRSTGRYGLAVLLIVAAWSCSASAAGGQAAVVEEPGADAGAGTGLPTAAAA
jgi:Na+/H+-dicarboxylate symporter